MAILDIFSRSAPLRSPSRSLRSPMQYLEIWRTRRALAALDADALRDIGVSAKAAATEAAKPIWDVPQTWRN